MAKQFMPDAEPTERLSVLRDSCYSQETTSYYRDLTQEQIDEKKSDFFTASDGLASLEDELDEIKADFKARMKPYKNELSHLRTIISTRREKCTGELYHLADHEAGIMETYDQNGDFVSARKLRPEEKQGKLFVSSKTGS